MSITRETLRIELQQQLDPLAPGCEFEIGEACDVAAGMSQAVDQSLADRIGNMGENDRYGFGISSYDGEARCSQGNDDIG